MVVPALLFYITFLWQLCIRLIYGMAFECDLRYKYIYIYIYIIYINRKTEKILSLLFLISILI